MEARGVIRKVAAVGVWIVQLTSRQANLAAILCLSSLTTVSGVFSANTSKAPGKQPISAQMPKPAPSFKRPASEDDLSFSRQTFRVHTEPEPQRPPLQPMTPLTGQVSKAAPLTGQTTMLDGRVADNGVIPTQLTAQTGIKAVPPNVFRGWIEQAHPRFALTAERNSPWSVIEVKGMYDNSSRTLEALGIPFQAMRGGGLRNESLDSTKVIVINCPGHVPRDVIPKLRDWVSRGGYLLTTDWSDEFVSTAFPGYVEWDRNTNRKSVYNAVVVNPSGPMFARTVSNARWKMDEEAHMIRTLRPDVRVLAASPELAAEDPAGRGALAAVFPFGRGYVMHMVGHFDNNTAGSMMMNLLADPAPVIGISLRQALAANFVVAGLSGSKITDHH